MTPQFAHFAKFTDCISNNQCNRRNISKRMWSWKNFRTIYKPAATKFPQFRTWSSTKTWWSLVDNVPFICPWCPSIIDYINSSLYSLSYYSIDDAYRIINKLKPGALLSKIDSFCLIPVWPADWNLLGLYWKQNFYLYWYPLAIWIKISTLPL